MPPLLLPDVVDAASLGAARRTGEPAAPREADVQIQLFLVGSNSDRNTIHGEERPSAAWKSSVSRISPTYAIRQSAKPRNPPVVHPTHKNSDEPDAERGEREEVSPLLARWVSTCDLQPMKKVAATIMTKADEILRSISSNLSNGLLEPSRATSRPPLEEKVVE